VGGRRRDIGLTPQERTAFLDKAHKAALATVDRDGFPHVVAMGFLAKDGGIYMTSYAKAQKVLNIRRNPKVGVMIETGQRYADFRGVMIRGHCEISDNLGLVERTMREIAARQTPDGAPRSEAVASARKRVVLKVTPEKITSWDHTKLGGQY
jgi:PPOX class probable F420-dependent enzyme